MRRTILSVCVVSLWAMTGLFSCKSGSAPLSSEEQARADSMALHVAIMPVSDCLPIVYAVGCGITDSLGVDVRLHDHLAQMDVDTALQKGHVQVAYSDLIRALRMMPATPVRAFSAGTSPMAMVALKSGRVRKTHQMKERMVAISRLSITDYWCDVMLDSAFMVGDDVYRPQVHDVQLRTDMLRTGLVDAAMLPGPYSRWMQRLGHKVVDSSPAKGPHLTAWLVRSELLADSFRIRQIGLLVEAMTIAAGRLASEEDACTLRQMMVSHCALPREIADSIQIDFPSAPAPVDTGAVRQAVHFLQLRNRLPANAPQDSLLSDSILSKMFRYEER